jgi:hypothetical protein
MAVWVRDVLWIPGRSGVEVLIPHAQLIADADVNQVPQISWGSAVLAATYRGLCTSVAKGTTIEGIFLGCPLLVQLWSYELLPVGRPCVDQEPYAQLLADHDDVDRPTIGLLWCLRKVMSGALQFL